MTNFERIVKELSEGGINAQTRIKHLLNIAYRLVDWRKLIKEVCNEDKEHCLQKTGKECLTCWLMKEEGRKRYYWDRGEYRLP